VLLKTRYKSLVQLILNKPLTLKMLIPSHHYKTMTNNYMKKVLLLAVFAIFHFTASAQEFTINGNITDAQTGEDLIGANIEILELEATGTSTNVYGFYSITLPTAEYTLRCQYLGYDAKDIKVNLSADKTVNIAMGEAATALEEIVIKGEKENINVTSTEVGVEKLNLKEIDKIPVLFGEKDVLKTIQLLPGVKSAGEGTSGFFVRGGSADQNLILLDEAPVYNASHAFGFFSVFNSDAIKDVKLYKGSIPPEYGGRLSSVLDVRMNEGNKNRFAGTGGIGLISSRLTLEGPIVKEKGSFIVSGRRTYADLFVPLAPDDAIAFDDVKLYFYDFNTKLNYALNDKNRIFLSGYFGRDRIALGDFIDFDWGNATGTFRWNHIYNPKIFSNTSFIVSNYSYGFSFLGDAFKVASTILDFNLKQNYDVFINNNNTLHFGVNGIYHIFDPSENKNETVGDEDPLFTVPDLEKRYSIEASAYISNEQKINNRINLDYGLRINNFTPVGKGNIFSYDENGEVNDTSAYNTLEPIANYFGLAPRFSSSFQFNDNISIKTAYARTYQYLHLLSNTTSSQPTDVWLPSSKNIKPQLSDQVALGYFQNFADNEYEFSTEIYYRWLDNIIDYKPGAQVSLNATVEGDLLFGKGRAYGLEFYVKKKRGRFTGWLSYTLARTESQFSEINYGDWFPARQDRTHDISIVASYQLTERIDLSGSWVYYTGNAVTWPGGKTPIAADPANITNGTINENAAIIVSDLEFRNNARLPAYHRLDASITFKGKDYKYRIDENGNKVKMPKKWRSSWNISAYNAYNRENPYSITFAGTEDNPYDVQATQLTLFKIVPSISYNFNF